VLNLKKAGKDFLTGILNFIYPPLCVACSKELESGLVCETCISELDSWRLDICSHCGWPIEPHQSCKNCNRNLSLTRVRALGHYATPLKELIHHLKYSNKRSLAKIIGAKMGVVLNSDPILKQAEYLIPIPLHPARKRERGYNQSELLAREISQFSGMPMIDCLKRKRNTKSQTSLSPDDRQKNVLDAFVARPNYNLQDKRVILIDDVSTSGATLDAAARALVKAGAKEVYGLCAAWA
jgi:ComF family protein